MTRFLTLYGKDDYDRHYASGAWRDETYLDLLERAAEARPDADALADARVSLTWRELRTCAAAAAERLASHGVGNGDVVVSRLPNRVELPILALACAWLEAVHAPLAVGSGPAQVANVLERVSASAYVEIPDGEAAAAATELGVPLVGRELDPTALLQAPEPAPRPRPSPDAVVDLMFTSGTTGVPKGILNTTNSKLAGLRGFIACMDLDSDDVWAVIPPMTHNAGWLYSYLPALATGARSVLLERWDPEQAALLLAREGVTATFLVPAHAVDLLEHVELTGSTPDALRLVLIGAAETPAELKLRIRDRLGATPVAMYGMTECQANLFTRQDDPLDVVLGSVGRPCPGMEVRLFASDRATQAQPGEAGEIATRGAGLFAGYYDDQHATSSAFSRDGWFFSGDLGVVDEAGNVSVVGRVKDVIVRGGANVVPEDVERAVSGCPGIKSVAVVGVPDARLGERVCACVVSSSPVDRDAVVAALRTAGIGRELWPDLVLGLDELPLTALGKVQRAKLRELAARELAP